MIHSPRKQFEPSGKFCLELIPDERKAFAFGQDRVTGIADGSLRIEKLLPAAQQPERWQPLGLIESQQQANLLFIDDDAAIAPLNLPGRNAKRVSPGFTDAHG